ncbi:hypothetical protein BpHYR1_007742, partial [Brachionus plicatilis]
MSFLNLIVDAKTKTKLYYFKEIAMKLIENTVQVFEKLQQMLCLGNLTKHKKYQTLALEVVKGQIQIQ